MDAVGNISIARYLLSLNGMLQIVISSSNGARCQKYVPITAISKYEQYEVINDVIGVKYFSLIIEYYRTALWARRMK